MRTTRDLFRPFLVAIGLAITLAWLATAAPVAAHGSVSEPPSRTYTCRFLQTDAGACARAWAANPQALYDWMEVNIGDAAGQHQAKIPDGRLCSAGRAKYAAFDEAAADWPTTALTPNAAGRYTIGYEATAPHATEYFRLYITRADYQPTQPLRWSDLELVHDSGPLSAQPTYRFEVSLPERSGHHILYQVWQRSDSPEAFYACSDVTLATGGATPATTATTAAPTSTASTSTAPTTAPSSSNPTSSPTSSTTSSTQPTSRPPTSPTTGSTTGQTGAPSSTVPGSGATVTSNDLGGSSSTSSAPTTAGDGTSSTAVAAGAGGDEQPGSSAESATGVAIDSSEVSLVERAADVPGLGNPADGGDPADQAPAIAGASAGETGQPTDVGQAGVGSGQGGGGNQLPLLVLAVVFGIVAAVLLVIGQRRAWLDRFLERRHRNRQPVVKPQSQWRQQPEWR